MYTLDWPRAYSLPLCTASFKHTPEDFQVDEYFDAPFTGEGEHIVLKIQKKGINTEAVVKSLSQLIDKPSKLISYAGLKDRQALTTQWISIHAPGEEIDGIDQFEGPGWKVLASTRHNKKIRPGFLAGNHFVIKLRESSNIDDFIQRIEQIKATGVPNYFGEQRFGRECGNLVKAEQVLVQGRRCKDRFLQGIYYSAARAWVYNLILAKRVKNLTWNTALIGDVMQLQGSKSIFVIEDIDDEIIRRINAHDLSPASPLPGKPKHLVQGTALDNITDVYGDWRPWITGLEKQGLEEAWRANILHGEQIKYSINNQVIELSFTLPAGAYATTLLRELVIYAPVS